MKRPFVLSPPIVFVQVTCALTLFFLFFPVNLHLAGNVLVSDC